MKKDVENNSKINRKQHEQIAISVMFLCPPVAHSVQPCSESINFLYLFYPHLGPRGLSHLARGEGGVHTWIPAYRKIKKKTDNHSHLWSI